jgi:hypothetical protein
MIGKNMSNILTNIPGGVFVQPKPDNEFIRSLYRTPVFDDEDNTMIEGEPLQLKIVGTLFKTYEANGVQYCQADLKDSEGHMLTMVWEL